MYTDNHAARAFWSRLGYSGFDDVVLYTKDMPED